jgi:peptidoglycan/xylan/chitin deacetylase (PgdA/CDA1 family)
MRLNPGCSIVECAQQVKRVAAIGISLTVLIFDSLGRVLYRLAGKKVPPTVVCLAYHSITKEQRLAFASQMDQLIRYSKPRRADSNESCAPGVRYATVTFDDGYQNLFDNALPEMARRGIPATIFVISGALSATPNWKDYSGGTDPAMSEPLLTAEQLRSLPSGLVQIGSHTVTHPMLTHLPEHEARAELSRSQTMLEAIIGRGVRLFSFPYGSASADLLTWCREEGYERVFITNPSAAISSDNDFVVRRVKTEPYDWPLEFRLKLCGTYRWRNRWRRRMHVSV